jgi:hypothetical protein
MAEHESNLIPLFVCVALLGLGFLLVSLVHWERCTTSLWCALTGQCL